MHREELNYIEEDEIDLRELFSTIVKNKFRILFLSFIVTFSAFLYTVTLPNIYTSETILLPQTDGKGGGLTAQASALAAMVGVNLGVSGISVDGLFSTLIKDFSFNREVIKKYNLVYKLSDEQISKNLVFSSFGEEFRIFLDSKSSPSENNVTEDRKVYDTYKKIKGILSISADKETGNIILKATFKDRFAAQGLVQIYLREMSTYIKKLDLEKINEQMKYYEKEFLSTNNLDLRANLNQLISSLVKKKVLSQSGKFYMVDQLTKPQVAYLSDKVKPKRGLIIIVAFITSIILGIFLVFLREFINSEPEPKKAMREESNLSF